MIKIATFLFICKINVKTGRGGADVLLLVKKPIAQSKSKIPKLSNFARLKSKTF